MVLKYCLSHGLTVSLLSCSKKKKVQYCGFTPLIGFTIKDDPYGQTHLYRTSVRDIDLWAKTFVCKDAVSCFCL